MTTLYGIQQCDTVRKAQTWLQQHEVAFVFHDFRKDGLDTDLLERLATQLGWETLLNRRSTSWRQLNDSDKTDLDAGKAVQLMLATPTLVKRPILDTGDGVFLLGFSVDQYKQALL